MLTAASVIRFSGIDSGGGDGGRWRSGDIAAAKFRRLARHEADGRVGSRLLAIANVLDGLDRATAARAAGMDRQTLRDWVIRFNADDVDGLRDLPRSGRPARLTEGEQATLKGILLGGPDPERDGVSIWRKRGDQALLAS